MKTHNLIQGSNEWHSYRANHFNASDAPAMLGESPYKTRTQLMHEMHTGITPEIDAATQRRFDDGHRFEALARPLAEKIIDEDLYPVTGSEGKLSASFDGITMDESIVFEHKTINEAIRQANSAEELPIYLRIQMTQQMMIANAKKCLFMASVWNDQDELIEEVHHWYEYDAKIGKQIAQGWTQFAVDLTNYTPVEVIEAATAAPVMGLPALSMNVEGKIAIISNLDKFGERLKSFVDDINKEPNDDQGFADAELAIKVLSEAESALSQAESNALAQTASVDEMRKTVALYADIARSTRLALEKMVKSRKETIRKDIAHEGATDFANHMEMLNKRLGKAYMPKIDIDCVGVMKGKKTLSSLRDAVNTEVARAKGEASAIADKLQINLNSLRELAKDHTFLFADAQQIIFKENDDLVLLINSRINGHEAAEKKRIEALAAAEVERIRAAEQAAANAELKAAQDKLNADVLVTTELNRIMSVPVISPSLETANARVGNHVAAEQASAAPTKKATPTREQMIHVIAAHYQVDASTATKWLANAFSTKQAA